MSEFNPDTQAIFLEKQDLAYSEKFPSISSIKRIFGAEISESFIMAQLENLNTFCGVDKKANYSQLSELARLISSAHYYLKVSEILLFFAKFKLGEYGKFYGVIDPIVISNALNEFLEERSHKIALIAKKKKDEELQKILKRCDLNILSKDEFDDLRWYFNY